MIIAKQKGKKFDQKSYDYFFDNIEYNLRELGFGDVAVNKKMKDTNKLFYDILLKINLKNDELKLNRELFTKYFEIFDTSDEKWDKCKKYFKKFYHFCFDMHPKNVLKELKKYKY